jgi:GNAT superfamily N-acetyltransferase
MAPDQASMVKAVEANLFAFFKHLAIWPRVEIHDEADCFRTISDLPFPLFNSVMRARAPLDRVDAMIDARIAQCRTRNVPMLWWTGPSTEPRDLGDRLVERGFLFEPAHGMAAALDESADLDESANPDKSCEGPPLGGPSLHDASVTIHKVDDKPTLKTWSRVLCDSFGAPQPFGDAFAELAAAIGLGEDSPFRHWLARVNGRPAATCSMFTGAGVAGIYDVATLPEKRRRGIARAITQAAMADARTLGYRMAILHSSSLGAGVYRSLGFREVCDIGQYVYVPKTFAR